MSARVPRRAALALALALAATACGGEDGSSTAVDAAIEPAEPADLGARCVGGCNLATCTFEDDDCAAGVCVWSQELGLAHCSRTCLATCAPGYRCERTADVDPGAPPVCIGNPRVCGNSIREVGEACDDGNTDDGDLCSADCGQVTQPPSSGTLTWTFHGGAPTTASGREPTVFAHRQSGRLFFGTDQTAVDYGLTLPDTLGPAPTTTSLDLSLTETVGTNLCGFQASTSASIRILDRAGKRIAGSASVVMTCQVGNCSFGCPQMVPHTIDFDLSWTEQP